MRPPCRWWVPSPLDPSDDAGIEKAVCTFMDLPAPIETACEDQSTFFHLLFSVTPNTPGNDTRQSTEKNEPSRVLQAMYEIIVRRGFLSKPFLAILSAPRLQFASDFPGKAET